MMTDLLLVVADQYFDIFSKLINRIEVRVGPSGFRISLKKDVQQSIDERIDKIEAARHNLLEGISAIDELKSEAERNKKEAQQIEIQVRRLEELKQQLQEEKENLKSQIQKDSERFEKEKEIKQEILNSDIEAFRIIAGVPSSSDIRRERIIGFISGVFASVVASGLLLGGTKALSFLAPRPQDPPASTPGTQLPQPEPDAEIPRPESETPQPKPAI